MKNLETRSLAMLPEVRTDGETRQVCGVGAVFNTETVIGGMWREMIAPGAFTSAIAGADVRGLFNHDPNRVMGRTSSGTMKLYEDATGLHYDITPNPDDPMAMGVMAMVARGDVTGSSIGFTVKSEVWTKPGTSADLPLRTITEVEWLRDVGPVTFPAYSETTAEARSAAEALRVVPEIQQDHTAENTLALMALEEVI